MARKKKAEEHENHERWLVSYADFITLLFAFFVVMYSMSSVNEGKYRVLSASMVAAFSPTTRSLTPIQVGELMRSPAQPYQLIAQTPKPVNIAPIPLSNQRSNSPFVIDPLVAGIESGSGEASEQIDRIASDVTRFFEQLITDEQIIVRKFPLWLEVEIKSNILFDSGSADLATAADGVMQRLGRLLGEYTNRIVVEGFTDNIPISSTIYPSNWELSSARAAAVIRSFESNGIASSRMSAVGFGEFRPGYSNDDDEGRAKNRRVIIVIMADVKGQDKEEYPLDDPELMRHLSNSQ